MKIYEARSQDLHLAFAVEGGVVTILFAQLKTGVRKKRAPEDGAAGIRVGACADLVLRGNS